MSIKHYRKIQNTHQRQFHKLIKDSIEDQKQLQLSQTVLSIRVLKTDKDTNSPNFTIFWSMFQDEGELWGQLLFPHLSFSPRNRQGQQRLWTKTVLVSKEQTRTAATVNKDSIERLIWLVITTCTELKLCQFYCDHFYFFFFLLSNNNKGRIDRIMEFI